MKIAVILNGISLRKKFFYDKVLPHLQQSHSVDVFETQTRHDAIFLASKATEKKYSLILAAGGDGTVNQVLNGILKGREELTNLPTIGVIPIGSGNDFARTLNVTANPGSLLPLLTSGNSIVVDVGKVQFKSMKDGTDYSYFINVADAGMGPEVVRRVTESDRMFGPSVAYYTAILSTFSTYRAMEVAVKTDDWEWHGKLNTLAVANGKYYGHGLCIAPDAELTDALFSTFIGGDASRAAFIWHSGKLKMKKKVTHPKVSYNKARHLQISSDKPCLIEADGELLGLLPATIDILPGKIKVLAPQ